MVDLGSLAFVVSALTLPAEMFCFFLVVSLTVNLEFGYAGVPNFGKVLFISIGAFVAGSFAYRLMVYLLNLKGDIFGLQNLFITEINNKLAANPYLAVEIFLFMIVVAAALGGFFGFLASYPAIRLREDYLGMLLLAAGEFFLIFSQAYLPFLGGAEGMNAPAPVFYIGTLIGQPDLVVLGVLVAAAILIYIYAERVGRSPLGRTLRALRDNEIASEAVGKDVVALRRNVLIVSSAIAGIAGVMWISFQPLMTPGTTPEATFNRLTDTFIPFVIVILGGAANNRGVLVGTFVYLLIYNAFSQGVTALGPSVQNALSLVGIDNLKLMLIGGLLIVILIRRPQGLIPEKPTLTMSRAKLKEMAEASKAKPKENEQQEKTTS
ncbi:MAG TPA: branched-chain amino acid ABC transporter permease [Nitrososphaerales archaeon]|nr:branched-chain amino acid ABC transporter permease [Nitrososphaerales archaeon]